VARITGFSLGVALGWAAAPAAVWAYELKTTSKGALVHWGAPQVLVELDLDGGPAGASGINPVRQAFAAWQDHLVGIALELRTVQRSEEGGDRGERDDRDAPVPDADDQRNLVRWVVDDWSDELDEDALATTLVTYQASTGRIIDADILINAVDHEWSTEERLQNCRSRYDLQNVIAHEVGHFLGLGHAPEQQNATMYPRASMCEDKKRDLDADDIAGVEALYTADATAFTDPAPAAAGCAVSRLAGRTGQAGGWSLLLAIALVGAVARRRLIQASVAGAVVASSAGLATASVLVATPVDILARRAEMVVRGDVVARQVVAIGGRIYTDSVVAVQDCWAGDCPAQVIVRQLGGEIGDVGMYAEGLRPLTPGEGVVVLLRRRRDGHHAPVGLGQGVFRLVRDASGSQKFARDLRDLVLLPGGYPAAAAAATLELWTEPRLRSVIDSARRVDQPLE
jgi:hypothetical protein